MAKINAAIMKKQNWEPFKDEGGRINQDLANAIKNHVQPDAEQVQALIQRHYSWFNHFWTPTKESYAGLAQMTNHQ